MMKIFSYIIGSLLFLTLSQFSFAELDPLDPDIINLNPAITVVLEDPGANASKSGIGNIRGFAITSKAGVPIVRIELYIDGVFQYNIPEGGPRPDVCEIYTGLYPGLYDAQSCENSGFGATTNYSELSEGSHTMTVRAVDSDGKYNLSTKTFTVERFHNSYVDDSFDVDMYYATVSLPRDDNGDIFDKTVYLENVVIDGECVDVELDWGRSIQGWAIDSIDYTDGITPLISPCF